MPDGKFVGRFTSADPRRVVDHGVLLRPTPTGLEMDVERMLARGMHVPAADLAAYDAGRAAQARKSTTPADINRMNRRFWSRDQAPDVGGEGEHRATFPKGVVSSISGDDDFLHVHGRDGDTMATFFGQHEARQQDDGTTTIYYLGEKPGALEKRQPEKVEDRAIYAAIAWGSKDDTSQGLQRRLQALNEANRRHDWSRHGR